LRRTAAVGVLVLCLVGRTPAVAQQNRASPHESISGTVGAAQLTITYGRPYMRGRRIFGVLVPYGRVWCPGADEATTLDSNRPMQIGDVQVPAGPHTIWILPTADAWTFIVSKEPSGFHTRYNQSADLGRVPMRKQPLANAVEQLTFAIDRDRATEGAGAIRMMWEQTEVSVPVRVTIR
jgi:hypothetical protein